MTEITLYLWFLPVSTLSRSEFFVDDNTLKFRLIKTFVDEDGVVRADVTQHTSTGRITFQLYREFVLDGKMKRSNFFELKHGAAQRRLLAVVEDFVSRETDRWIKETRARVVGDR